MYHSLKTPYLPSFLDIAIRSDGHIVGEYFADVLVEDKVVIELKATEEVSAMSEIQCYNYLRATGIQVGLVLAFGARKLVICRVDCPE
ncbi:MAG: GxxExxY protein [Selenomonadales bacterium]|nr:GxxExxY protein [Selenomonadales bacterium]